MGKNKIYLSIDDLHKLYGISPEVVKQIKKKRRKRRIKKQLKNSFGGVKSSSDFMQGSASVVDKLFVEKHLKTINDENRRLEAQPIPPIEQQHQKHLEFFNKTMDGIGNGDIKFTQNKTGFSLKNPKLVKKRVSKKSKQVEEVNDEEEYEPPVYQAPINQLAGVSTRSMNRLDPEEVLNDLDDAFDVGGNNNGSDMFIASNNDDIPPNAKIDDENQKANDAKDALDEENRLIEEQQLSDELNKQMEDKKAIYEENLRIEEQDAIDEENRQIEEEKKVYVPQSIKHYSVEDLKEIMTTNNIKILAKYLKKDLYNLLLVQQLV